MEKTIENIARCLTWFKDSLRARSGMVEERQNKAHGRGTVSFCTLKSHASGRTVSEMIRVSPTCADTESVVRVKDMA